MSMARQHWSFRLKSVKSRIPPYELLDGGDPEMPANNTSSYHCSWLPNQNLMVRLIAEDITHTSHTEDLEK